MKKVGLGGIRGEEVPGFRGVVQAADDGVLGWSERSTLGSMSVRYLRPSSEGAHSRPDLQDVSNLVAAACVAARAVVDERLLMRP